MRCDNVNLDMILTTKEASEKYPVADCTIRAWIKEGVFKPNDYRKSGNTWLIKRNALEEILKKKNMLGKEFVLDNQKVYVRHLGYKSKNIEIWYQSDKTKEVLENIPFKDFVNQMFEIYKKEKKVRFKNLIIDDNLQVNDNWLFEKEKTWAITLKGVIDTMKNTLQTHNIDTSSLDEFLKSYEEGGK